MATKKQTKKKVSADEAAPARSDAYEKALVEYGQAFELLRAGKHAEAREAFQALASANHDEAELVDRAKVYIAVCDRKLAESPPPPGSAEEFYLVGVMHANDGRLKEALQLLDHAIERSPSAPKYLYARASVYALMEQPDAACNDLRRAVLAEPTLRFQASNDPDFEKIRDDAAFIDVIEPTPAGA